ncbi:hypothetical protein DAI22_02g247200 [Oryza sativa Japonica Group]|nr:hypothetical protein DAI22_02g247200 [Oryza sativa Japonica Group]
MPRRNDTAFSSPNHKKRKKKLRWCGSAAVDPGLQALRRRDSSRCRMEERERVMAHAAERRQRLRRAQERATCRSDSTHR